MMPTGAFLGLLIIAAIAWFVLRKLSENTEEQALSRPERSELNGLRTLVDDLKETAWEHRELDSPLSTIIIDKIRSYERRSRELGS